MNLRRCSGLPRQPLTGVWYRAIPLQHISTALQTTQTKWIPGRFNAGTGVFEILYLCENHLVALTEVGALFGSVNNVIPNPAVPWGILNVKVTLNSVVDLTASIPTLDSSAQELTGDWRGYEDRASAGSLKGIETGMAPTQSLGDVLYSVAPVEGFLTFSAKSSMYRCLAIFPQKVSSPSMIEFFDPSGKVIHTIP